MRTKDAACFSERRPILAEWKRRQTVLALSLTRDGHEMLIRYFVVLIALGWATTSLSGQELSREGRIRHDAHRFLINEFVTDRVTKITGNATADEDRRILQELVVLNLDREIDSHAVIELPEGAQRVAGMFRHLTLRGEGLLRIRSIRLLPFAAQSHLHQSKSEDSFYRVQMPSLPVPRPDLEKISLELHCEGAGETRVTSVEFHSQGKLSMVFDDIPFRNLGAERPRRAAAVHIDPNSELRIAGSSDLEAQRWFRYYALPGRVPSGLERWAHERGFFPGRQIVKLQPSLVVGYSKDQPKLVEDADRPGHADLSFFDSYDSGMGLSNAIPAFRDTPFATCFDEWPAFMSRHPGGRGTPKIEHFDAAAELAAAFVADQIKSTGRTATWWEVKNESSIKSEWDYHYEADVNAWELLADFHNRVATQVKRRSPEVRVGGPTSAWMQLQVNDFGLYKSQREFMDRTADSLDFYSHHFYEDSGTIGAYERRSSKYTNYLLGRFEAILDMLHAHMAGTENTKPILITECGSLQPGRSASDDWLRLRSWNAYLTKAMQRPDQVGMIVPFVFLNVPWNPTSGNAAFEPLTLDPETAPQVEGEPIDGYRRRQVSRFFDLWRGFNGRRLALQHDQDFLDVVAVHHDDTLMVAATNMGGDRLNVVLSSLLKSVEVSKITQRRMYYRDGAVVYEELDSKGTSFPVDVEETTVLEIKLTQRLSPSEVVEQRRAYAADTAVKLEQRPTTFEIAIENVDSIEESRLVLGLHRNGGIAESLDVTVNGNTLQIQEGWLSEMNHLFAPVTVTIPVESLRPVNQVKISGPAGATMTSLHLLLSHRTNKEGAGS
ncbi:MAG: beta-agarase [Planctomycetota bacterium]